mmetsp:Transcript_1670/g.2538  ORF Transcript_1670/g.2538 Transcript_1670/m.2538 type:complete len:434 (-) Transcript_1670:39-1340(-)
MPGLPNSHNALAQRLLRALNSTRVISLTSSNLKKSSIIQTPEEFHSEVCRLVRSARDRISIASLYIGPGASALEKELLTALHDAKAQICILMDQNRGTRPVNATTSAQSVHAALKNEPVHLYQTLREPLKTILPSPLNEAAGVFHIKSYIIDNDLILSGANLSQEYFYDRQDRYVRVHGGDLVEFYADLVKILSTRAYQYPNDGTKASQEQFLNSIAKLFGQSTDKTDENVVAYAIPTFQHPNLRLPFTSDVDQIRNLLDATAKEGCSVKLASAYLNPTQAFISCLQKQHSCELLTAGPISHGFAPKAGVKRRGDSVPLYFLANSLDLKERNNLSVKWYNRLGWTFHAKGLWIISPAGHLVAAVVGSGNFGYRSEQRDIESNCVLIFPQENSPIQEAMLQEWDRLHVYAEEPMLHKPLGAHIRALLPLLKSYL